MVALTIRNLTTTPLELRRIERFHGEPVPGEGIKRVASKITSIFNASSHTPPGVCGVSLKPGKGWVRAQEFYEGARHVPVAPFEARATGVRAADPGGCEVARLFFRQPGTENRWSVDCPGPSRRSLVMRREAGGDDESGGPAEFTIIYSLEHGHLTVLSSGGLAHWMRELRDEFPLSMLSIPGTHNSPTCYKALPSVRCQAVGVREQLDNGVRYLDVRVSCSPDSDDLTLVHAAFPVSLTGSKYLHDLLAECYAFLDENPREALIMSLKREGTGKGTDGDMSRHLSDRYCGRDDARRWFTDSRIPTLGEVRGRIVLLRRFWIDDSLKGHNDGRGFAMDGEHWPDNCDDGTVGSGLIRVQDFYEMDQSTNIDKKTELARAQLERASEQCGHYLGMPDAPEQLPGPNPLFVNFLTASNFFSASCWPEKIAAKVNPAIIEYLCMRHGDHGKGPNQLAVGDSATGIVITDWVGKDGDWDLIRAIVGWNARLQLK
ncbi:hypothetical protein RB594_003043 [Gaeumannomyces avenae]